MITNHLLNGMILPVGRYVSSLEDEGYTRIPPPIQDARSNDISYSMAGSKIDSFASYVNRFFFRVYHWKKWGQNGHKIGPY